VTHNAPVKTAVDTGSGRSPIRIDLFVKPMRNEHQPEGPLIWIGESNFPIGFRVGANSLPELVELAGIHGRQLLPGEDIDLHIFLVPDKVPPEPVVEVHVDPAHSGPDDFG
jgi:hypothetical protein